MYNIDIMKMKKIDAIVIRIRELQAKGLHGVELAEAMKEGE